MTFDGLYARALSVVNPRALSDTVGDGGVAARLRDLLPFDWRVQKVSRETKEAPAENEPDGDRVL